MKFAVISDIHANLEALSAVLKDCEQQKVDKIHCLGDVVGYGCNPSECLDLVARNCEVKLLGNHEYMVLDLISENFANSVARASMEWTQKQIGDIELSILEDFTVDAVIDDLYFVHSSPRNPEEWNYILTAAEANEAFEDLRHSCCFIGHTHLPMIYLERTDKLPRVQNGHDILMDADYRYIINVGSVGQPRDEDPRASYVIFDSKTLDLKFQRVAYDIAATQQKMTEANLPKMLVERLSLGR